MNYTKEQLRQIGENLKLISRSSIQILKTIKDEEQINHTDVHLKSGTSKFVTDKCIAAFIVTGLIERIDDGVKRFYVVTQDGKNLLEEES